MDSALESRFSYLDSRLLDSGARQTKFKPKRNSMPKIALIVLGGTILSASAPHRTQGYTIGALGIRDILREVFKGAREEISKEETPKEEMPKSANATHTRAKDICDAGDDFAMLKASFERKLGAEIEIQELANIDSADMDDAFLWQLAQAVESTLARDDMLGALIIQGSDTLEESAYFLHLIATSQKPIVFSAAMRHARAFGSDGARNLYNALHLTASPQARDKGVLVVMDDVIMSARDLRKRHMSAPHAFAGQNLGSIIDGRVYFRRVNTMPHTHRTPFSLESCASLASGAAGASGVRVGVVYATQDDSAYMQACALVDGGKVDFHVVDSCAGDFGKVDSRKVDSHVADSSGVDSNAVDSSAKGLIIVGFGAGNIPSHTAKALYALSARSGVIIVRCSRVDEGMILLQPLDFASTDARASANTHASTCACASDATTKTAESTSSRQPNKQKSSTNTGADSALATDKNTRADFALDSANRADLDSSLDLESILDSVLDSGLGCGLDSALDSSLGCSADSISDFASDSRLDFGLDFIPSFDLGVAKSRILLTLILALHARQNPAKAPSKREILRFFATY
ncbi:hypothetical protein BKN38_08150 [Helicobacter sp. CLO-3]|nr:hypothetical protein BA723_08160 [Helicobacter sp. CLO-3]OHU81856.1 hypothetical protein BKN38_08150 [Helicobacter sp. CLO-3]